ncbi:hypothetical protein AVEN_190375-1 [Araneus ventricosus]|uniref:Uncharacterized protein n=1 Tax=Araneus ventricosus TaxID=182803 RepID=A0A4Y2JPW1_ARAVE|nr:hypothetical protein AVEN_190375-1 [Araneus ventricosus]
MFGESWKRENWMLIRDQNVSKRKRGLVVLLSDGSGNSSTAEAGVLMAITAGGKHYHDRGQAPAIIVLIGEGRPPLSLIRRLLIHVLVVPPRGTTI